MQQTRKPKCLHYWSKVNANSIKKTKGIVHWARKLPLGLAALQYMYQTKLPVSHLVAEHSRPVNEIAGTPEHPCFDLPVTKARQMINCRRGCHQLKWGNIPQRLPCFLLSVCSSFQAICIWQTINFSVFRFFIIIGLFPASQELYVV